MPDKLTDNEIVKALEICSTYKASCKNCPAFVKVDRSNCRKVLIGAKDIINRLQAENENLRDSLVKKRFKDEMFEMTLKEYTDGKIKEFAERLKENSIATFSFKGVVMVEEIDDLVKEMTGEDNESKN